MKMNRPQETCSYKLYNVYLPVRLKLCVLLAKEPLVRFRTIPSFLQIQVILI